MDEKENIINTIEIFGKYPPLTSRLNCQLEFLIVCLKDNSINNYLKKRNTKYNLKSIIIKKHKNSFAISYYFPAWLSGFLETKGDFLINKKGNPYFSIRHADDYYLINSIKDFFDIKVKIISICKTFYSIKTYNKEVLNKIVNHCILYPLLGDKSRLLDKFKVFHK